VVAVVDLGRAQSSWALRLTLRRLSRPIIKKACALCVDGPDLVRPLNTYMFLSAVQCVRSSLGRVPRGLLRHLPGPSVAESGGSTPPRSAGLLQ